MGFEIKCVKPLKRCNCCCCNCTLKTGTLIIGWLGVIGAVLEIFYGAAGLIMFDGKNVPHNIGKLPEEGEEEIIVMTPAVYQATLITYVVFGCFAGLLHGLLVYGAMKEKANILQLLVIVDLVFLIICPVLIICITIKLFSLGVILAVMYLVYGFIVMGLGVWCWMIIYSFYRQVEERNNLQNRAYPHNALETGKLSNPEQTI